MKSNIITEFRIKTLLSEIDWNENFSDVNPDEKTDEHLLKDMNDEMKRRLHNFQIDVKRSGFKEKDRIKSPPNRPIMSLPMVAKNTERMSQIRDKEEFEKRVGGVVLNDVIELRNLITQRPRRIIDQNSKMEKSDEGKPQITINTGIPALRGIVFDEENQKFFYINTCPGAGSCILGCYARKNQYIMNHFKILGLTQRLNFFLNDPEGYKNQILSEIDVFVKRIKRMEKSTGEPHSLKIRWNDAGDMFSNSYFQMAKDITEELTNQGVDVTSYAYTKMGKFVKLRSEDFILRFSTDAKASEREFVNLESDPFSENVPEELFYELFLRNKNGTFYKGDEGDEGEARFKNEKKGRQELKRRIYNEYKDKLNVRLEDIKYVNELPEKLSKMDRFSVIMIPGGSDIAAQRPDVRGLFVLQH